jgi:hypothetical protein
MNWQSALSSGERIDMKSVVSQIVAVIRSRNQIVFGVYNDEGTLSPVTLLVPAGSMNWVLNHIHTNLKALTLVREFSPLLHELVQTGECSESLKSINEKAHAFLHMSPQQIIDQAPVTVTTERSPTDACAHIHFPMGGECGVDSANLEVVASIMRLITATDNIKALLQEMIPWVGGYLNGMPVASKGCHRIARLVQSAHDMDTLKPVGYGAAGAMLHIRDTDALDVVNGTLQVNGTSVVVEYPQCDRVYLNDGVIATQSQAQNKAVPIGKEFVLYTYA